MKASMHPETTTRLNKWPGFLIFSLAFLWIAGIGFDSFAGSFQYVSVVSPTVGAPAGGGGDSLSPVVSGDGRYVLFSSSANNLALTMNNTPIAMRFPPKMNVYLRDRTNGTTTLVSLALDGTNGANGDSFPVDISTNGHYVLFESTAANLVSAATNGLNNIYMRDLSHGTTTLVSVNTNGFAGNDAARNSAMTPDGRYVVFVSSSSDLVTGDTNGIPDVFVRDLQAGTTTLVSQGAQGTIPNGSDLPDITPDGRYVAFYSTATNIVAGVNTTGEIYVRDLVLQTTAWVSAYAHTMVQQQYNSTDCLSLNHAISDDGQYIAYEAICSTSSASNGIVLRYNKLSGLTDIVSTNASSIIVGSELNHHNLDMTPDGRFIAYVANSGSATYPVTVIYQWDAESDTNSLVSGTYSGNAIPASSACDYPAMDPTGRYVSFAAQATGLTPDVTSGFHLYRRDMQAGTTQLIDASSSGAASGGLYDFPRMSTDGSLIVFESNDKTIVTNDNNNSYDIFAANLESNGIDLISCANPNLPSITPNGLNTLSQSSVSADARYIAFSSEASNFSPADNNGYRDVFARDTLNGANILVSVDAGGILPGNGPSANASISSDGRYVAFTSFANNLVGSDNNGSRDIFVRDLQLRVTSLVSVSSSGAQGNADSYSPVISADGRYVLFHSLASSLAGTIGSTNYDNLYWRDTQAGITKVFTTNTSTAAAAGTMTPDGRYVAVVCPGKSLYIWDTQSDLTVYTNTVAGGYGQVVLAISPDGTRVGLEGGAPTAASKFNAIDRIANTSVALQGGTVAPHYLPRFNANSRYVAYVGKTNNINQIFCYDFQTGANALISQANAIPGNANSDSPDISSDGRYVAYRSLASNLGPGAANGIPNIYLYDSVTGSTALLSGNTPAFGRSLSPVFSDDGQTLVFASWDSGLASQDFNQYSDIFSLNLSDTNAQPAFMAFILPGAQGQPPVINWPVTAGKHYQVQFKNQLSDPVWQMLNGSVVTSGNQQSLTDPAPPTGQRFYRVVSY